MEFTLDRSKDIADVISFYQRGFTVVLALALGEGFKQFVRDRVEEPHEEFINWSRLPALVGFLLLILPFFQGMNRYFYITYVVPLSHALRSISFGRWRYLIIEAAIFFIMSRALSLGLWRRFYEWSIILAFVDLFGTFFPRTFTSMT